MMCVLSLEYHKNRQNTGMNPFAQSSCWWLCWCLCVWVTLPGSYRAGHPGSLFRKHKANWVRWVVRNKYVGWYTNEAWAWINNYISHDFVDLITFACSRYLLQLVISHLLVDIVYNFIAIIIQVTATTVRCESSINMSFYHLQCFAMMFGPWWLGSD